MVQTHKTKTHQEHDTEAKVDELPAPVDETKLNDDIDAILEEIDAALGDLTDSEVTNFVNSYIQKGGQ